MSSFRMSGRTAERGAALVVGLILLVVVTVLAISGMNTATTELAIARNDQNREFVFQAAETGLERALSQSVFSAASVPTSLGEYTIPGTAGRNRVTTTITFEAAGPPPPGGPAFSLGVGSGMSAVHFVAEARAESARVGDGSTESDRDASAVHTQAFYVVAPESPAL